MKMHTSLRLMIGNTMKKSLLALAIVFIGSLSVNAYAAGAPNSELIVSGSLKVPSCTITPAADGVYDIGKQSATLVKPAAETQLATISQNWLVQCDADTYLVFTPIDNRADSSSKAGFTYFGLGHVNGEGKIGYFSAAITNGQVDGVSSKVFVTSIGAIGGAATANLASDARTGWSDGKQLQSGKLFSGDIVVSPVLGSTATMNGPVTEDTDIDGSLTLSFGFGI